MVGGMTACQTGPQMGSALDSDALLRSQVTWMSDGRVGPREIRQLLLLSAQMSSTVMMVVVVVMSKGVCRNSWAGLALYLALVVSGTSIIPE